MSLLSQSISLNVCMWALSINVFVLLQLQKYGGGMPLSMYFD